MGEDDWSGRDTLLDGDSLVPDLTPDGGAVLDVLRRCEVTPLPG